MHMKLMFKILVSTLLISGTLKMGHSQNLLTNPGFEDTPYDNHWVMAKLSGGDGTIASAGSVNAHTGNEACLVTSTLVNSNFGKFGLKSEDYNTSSTNFTAKVWAKTDAAGVASNIGFKIQIAAIATDGATKKYFASQEFKLSETYKEFTFTKDASSLGLDFATVRVVFQCAGYLGNYYFDDVVLDDGSTTGGGDTVIINPVEVTPLNGISTTDKIIAFSFDDGPGDLSLQIAELFESHGGNATFFNAGKNLSGREAIVTALLNRGHEIGNHTMTHSRLPDYESDTDIYYDIVDFQELYKSNFEYTSKLFRAPYLDYGQVRNNDTITPDKDDRVGGVLTTEKLTPINASVYSGDASSTVTAAEVLTKMRDNITTGDIVLCHEKAHTLEALQTLIPELSSQGYRFVTVSQLLRYEEGWESLPANDTNIIVYGSNYSRVENGQLLMHRHSQSAYAGTNFTNLFDPVKARTGSGIVFSFQTASPRVNLHLKIRNGNSSGSSMAVYQNVTITDTLTFGYEADKEFLAELTSVTPGEETTYKVTLPIWTDVSLLGIELEKGYSLSPVAKESKPVYLAYGNSITHGRGQDIAVETYPYLLAEKLDWELYNTAVGGGKVSQVAAEMIRDDFQHIDYMTILIGYNDYNGQGVDTTEYRRRYTSFIETVREKHPATKIFCITLTTTTTLESAKTGIPVEDFRTVAINVVKEKQYTGDTNIFIIHGDKLTTEADLNDPVHLNIQGASNFADSLFNQISSKLNTGMEPGTSAIEKVFLKSNEDVIVYPNPCKNYIIINGIKDNSRIFIRNLNGRLIHHYSNASNNKRINLSSLEPGSYYLTIRSGNNYYTQMIIRSN